ncbi:tryptophan-rich sensory protein TspO [Wenxinia saemankumensis]|uniref:TspO and MBR related proteins n=1 Tax=Wenxinia saemankumensis TaxID=1447782 RepID=A0A1M6G7E2_9RHOB|nr:TspO/MBR family protein [Wenxinia saemankumensis]SHJ05839.1 TspO and MBR related proteins [Wenxinia saemankumensis]
MDWIAFALFLAAAAAAGATGAMFPTGAWLARLDKPSWMPPNRAFPVVWTTLYLLMALAGGRIVHAGGGGVALAFWALQIALNTLWTPVFFGARRMRAGLWVIGALWMAVLGFVLAAWPVDRVAALLFLPSLAWVSVAAALNASLLRRNPDERPLRLSDL